MTRIEWIQALTPAGIAAIPLFLLWWQLRDQNRLQRKKVEVEYLRRALDLLDSPLTGVLRIISSADDVVVERITKNLSHLEVLKEIQRLANEWDEILYKHRSAVFTAQAFAAEQKQKPLVDVLARALTTANNLGELGVEALKRITASEPQVSQYGPDFAEKPQVSAALAANAAASVQLVKRIRQLYG